MNTIASRKRGSESNAAACTAQWLTAQTGMPAGAMQHFVVGAGWVSLTVPPPSADHDIVLKVVCV